MNLVMIRTRVAACAAAAVAALALPGCSTPIPATAPPVETAVPVPTARAAPPAPQVAPAAPPAQPSAAPQPQVASTALPAHLDPASPVNRERSVHFDFDESTIKSEYTAMIERHARYLASQAALAVRIEGNADERGSHEYNLALGQRRADAVARALRLLGVKDSQMETVSFGEERPRAGGHDESAWSQNRRADIVYPAR
jgi:peptidoglycan-associated lipoprotein